MDRQDIDALLIGALYGELTPADEARLAAHLESHPADRGALADLKVARQAVADSRIFAVQLEPPQAISAVLLQEAHRRAPKRAAVAADEPREGWFYRFTRSFLAHPAMAAAAMLVLVLGGAGLVYMKKGDDQFANREVAMQSAPQESGDRGAPAAMAPSATPAAGDGVAPGAAQGSAYNADLYEGAAADEAERAEGDMASARVRADQLAQEKLSLEQAKREQQVERRKGAPPSGIVVGTETGSPKDFEDARDRKAKVAKADTADLDDSSMARGGGAGGGGVGVGRASAGPSFGGESANAVSGADRAAEPTYAQPPPPPAQVAGAKSAPTTTAAPRPATPESKSEPPAPKKTVAKPSAEKAPTAPSGAPATADKEESRPESALLAWAKTEHQKAIALAQQKNCAAAAKIAISVSRRAKDYYAQNMATDRALKQCTAYIAQEREREAEQTRKKATTATDVK